MQTKSESPAGRRSSGDNWFTESKKLAKYSVLANRPELSSHAAKVAANA